MTLTQAVEVLNKNNHDGHDDWKVNTLHSFMEGFIFYADTPADSKCGENDYKMLKQADAIAIAEKYERERTTN